MLFNFGIKKIRYITADTVIVRFRWWRKRRYWRLDRTDMWRPIKIYPTNAPAS